MLFLLGSACNFPPDCDPHVDSRTVTSTATSFCFQVAPRRASSSGCSAPEERVQLLLWVALWRACGKVAPSRLLPLLRSVLLVPSPFMSPDHVDPAGHSKVLINLDNGGRRKLTCNISSRILVILAHRVRPSPMIRGRRSPRYVFHLECGE